MKVVSPLSLPIGFLFSTTEYKNLGGQYNAPRHLPVCGQRSVQKEPESLFRVSHSDTKASVTLETLTEKLEKAMGRGGAREDHGRGGAREGHGRGRTRAK